MNKIACDALLNHYPFVILDGDPPPRMSDTVSAGPRSWMRRHMVLARKIAADVLRQVPISRLRGIGRCWRDLEQLRIADTALVSFPKSGRTFVRVMLARLYQRQFGIDEREVLEF